MVLHCLVDLWFKVPGRSLVYGSPWPGRSLVYGSPSPGRSLVYGSPLPGRSLVYCSLITGRKMVSRSSVHGTASVYGFPMPVTSVVYGLQNMWQIKRWLVTSIVWNGCSLQFSKVRERKDLSNFPFIDSYAVYGSQMFGKVGVYGSPVVHLWLIVL